jgi:hypothetical protein
MVWLLGTGAATAITIEGVRVVGSNVINGESAISPRQANAALSGRTTTTPAPPATTIAVTTTVTTPAPTTTTEAPTTVPETAAVTPTTVRSGPTTTKKKPVTTTTTKKAVVTTVSNTPAPPSVTTAVPVPTTATPPTQPPPPPTTQPPPTTAPSSQCIQQTRVTEGGFVSACFTAQKVSILGFVAYNGWRPEQQQGSGQVAIVRFIKGSRVITVVASWSGGPQWSVSDTG